MLLYVLAGVAAVALLHLLLKRLATLPAKYHELTTPTLQYRLRGLYGRGLGGAYLQIDLRRTGAYVQVYKTILSRGVVQLSVHVPSGAQTLVEPRAIERAFSEHGFAPLSAGRSVCGRVEGLVQEVGLGPAVHRRPPDAGAARGFRAIADGVAAVTLM